MPRLRALTSWADRKRGEEFDASEADARLLTARDLPGGPKAEIIETRVLVANDSPLDTEETSTTRRGRYGRRDMRARE